jgi:hypothetical protein
LIIQDGFLLVKGRLISFSAIAVPSAQVAVLAKYYHSRAGFHIENVGFATRLLPNARMG